MLCLQNSEPGEASAAPVVKVAGVAGCWSPCCVVANAAPPGMGELPIPPIELSGNMVAGSPCVLSSSAGFRIVSPGSVMCLT